MIKLLGLGAATLSLAMAASAHAQDDDWEFQEDAAQQIAVAAVRYDAGQMIVVQCRQGALTLVVAGLPVTGDELRLAASRGDGRRDEQTWRSAGSPGAFRSEVTARDVRFMRGGGAYALRSLEGAPAALAANFDLPAQNANLDRVLSACGWSAADDRDALQRTTAAFSLTDPDRRSRPRTPSRSVSGGARRGMPPPRPNPIFPAEQQLSCIVRDLHLTECRPDHSQTGVVPEAAGMLESINGSEVYAPDGAIEEGRVAYLHVPRVITVVDYIATTPR